MIASSIKLKFKKTETRRLIRVNQADVAQRQSIILPSWGRGIDTRHRLHVQLATVYKTKADYLLSGLTVCLLIRCFEEFSANQKIQGGLVWRHLSDSFLMWRVTQDLMKQLPEWA